MHLVEFAGRWLSQFRNGRKSDLVIDMAVGAVFEASLSWFLQPIASLLGDESITEIMITGPFEIFVERSGRLELSSASFEDEDALLSAIQNLTQYAGREIGPEQPILDAKLPNGARVHAIIPPATRGLPCVTIRKFRRDVVSLEDLITLDTLSHAAAEFLGLCVLLRKNIVIAGASGAGKTSMLSALAATIPNDERLIVIEDTAELVLDQPNCVYLQSRSASGGEGPSVRQLFVAALRMRPDRILVGEVRGGETLDMLQAMLSGHSGSLCTVHANMPRDALVRLETMSLMSDIDLPVYVARAQVASAVHLVVQLARFPEDGSRRVTRITEVHGLTSDQQYCVDDLFSLGMPSERSEHKNLRLIPTGYKPTFAAEAALYGFVNRVGASRDLWTS